MWDALWLDLRLATMREGGARYGAIDRGALGVSKGHIAWIGKAADLPDAPARLASDVHDGGRRWATPGLIDCHTHLVYGGDRAAEFELRLEGASYEEIARNGGGIRATVAATRAADEESLFRSARQRLDRLAAEGVAVVEIKSGYGLDAASEAKCLRVARRLGRASGITVVTSFLGAHALPPEYEGASDDYVAEVVRMLPALAAEGLVDAVDAFCERIAFTPAQIGRVFGAAKALGLPVKLHAEQLGDSKGAVLAAEHGALSADHLEYIGEDGVAAMARAGTVAVLLPSAFYFLREQHLPPIELFRRHDVPIALATDCNPGSSPVTSLLLILNMACTLFRLTPEEALAGVTRNGARALGLAAGHGTLEIGKRADFVLWDIASPAELCYRLGWNPCAAIVRAGVVV